MNDHPNGPDNPDDEAALITRMRAALDEVAAGSDIDAHTIRPASSGLPRSTSLTTLLGVAAVCTALVGGATLALSQRSPSPVDSGAPDVDVEESTDASVEPPMTTILGADEPWFSDRRGQHGAGGDLAPRSSRCHERRATDAVPVVAGGEPGSRGLPVRIDLRRSTDRRPRGRRHQYGRGTSRRARRSRVAGVPHVDHGLVRCSVVVVVTHRRQPLGVRRTRPVQRRLVEHVDRPRARRTTGLGRPDRAPRCRDGGAVGGHRVERGDHAALHRDHDRDHDRDRGPHRHRRCLGTMGVGRCRRRRPR